MIPARRRMCATCIFREDGGALELAPGRLDEIRAYSVAGTAHACHSPGPSGRRDELACRGARDFTLTLWHRMGLIAAPTDAALEAAMRAHGIDPNDQSGEA